MYSFTLTFEYHTFISFTHSVHDHAADLQDGHVGLLTLVSLPHYGAHSLQTGVGAVQPGNMTLRGKNIHTTTSTLLTFYLMQTLCSVILL